MQQALESSTGKDVDVRRVEMVGPQVGKDLREKALFAMFYSLLFIAIYISGAAKTVIGIEIAESAVNDAMNNCRINGISNCRFILGDIKEKLAELTTAPDVMIIDPPRAGMHKDVVYKILEFNV